MSALDRTLKLLRRLSCPTAVLGAGFLFFAVDAGLASAQGTKLWNQSQFEEFERGTPQGVAITSDGHLTEGPGAAELATTPSTFVWSIAADKNGTAYVGTGSPATVLRVGSDQKLFTLFRTKDVNVQAVHFGPDGALYVATLPSGKVYRLKPDATTEQDENSATVVFDASKIAAASPAESKPDADKSPKPHYIWDLTFDTSGRLYIAAGDPGAIYRVDPNKPNSTPETFFKTDEAHIRALVWDAKGNLIAGSDGSGLVYRISPDGNGYVLFDSPRREVTSLAVGSNGTIYAACVGDKGHNPLPPLPVQGVGAVTITIVQPGSVSAANASTSVPEGTEIYAIKENQAPRKIWADKENIVYALAYRPEGLLALTGNRGRVFRIEDNGTFADVAHLNAQQGLSLAPTTGDAVLVGTGNTGKIFKLSSAGTHEYASDVLDAGAFARFGRVEIEPGSSGYQILTRTGNIEQPVRGWTEWQPVSNGAVASPPGRFLQWKVQLQSRGHVGAVGVNYLPVNTAPSIDDMVVFPGARINAQNATSTQPTVNINFPSASQNTVSFDAGSSTSPLQAVKDRTAITVRWAAHDDNGDDLIYALYIRGDGESVWRLLKDKITDKAYSFDSTQIPDGGYQIRVEASDAPSQPPGEALSGEKISDRFVIDTTPPVVSGLKTTGGSVTCEGPACSRPVQVVFDADDAASPISHAEYSIDAGPWQYVEPVGKISDSPHEHYDFKIKVNEAGNKAGEHLITVRAYDRYDNVGLSKMVIPAQGQ